MFSRAYSSCSSLKTCLTKNCCSCSLAKLMHSCSKLQPFNKCNSTGGKNDGWTSVSVSVNKVSSRKAAVCDGEDVRRQFAQPPVCVHVHLLRGVDGQQLTLVGLRGDEQLCGKRRGKVQDRKPVPSSTKVPEQPGLVEIPEPDHVVHALHRGGVHGPDGVVRPLVDLVLLWLKLSSVRHFDLRPNRHPGTRVHPYEIALVG
ncbi:hypothetical protein EYF80_015604 [Liparis tanakae]|uniref:Uncharacterized protein n=1 Tax=Liparis tanakae TaxID=230148 RepID=A0A4Z2I7X4_9TELE|nr:hypothetical protein EYF80_015604 [Liparis tanakae]